MRSVPPSSKLVPALALPSSSHMLTPFAHRDYPTISSTASFPPDRVLSVPDSMLISSIALLAFALSSYQVQPEAIPIVSFLVRILVTLQCLLIAAGLIMVGVRWIFKRIGAGCVSYSRGTSRWDPLEGRNMMIRQSQLQTSLRTRSSGTRKIIVKHKYNKRQA